MASPEAGADRLAQGALAFWQSARPDLAGGRSLLAFEFAQIRLRRSVSAGRWIVAVDAERCVLLSI